MGIFSELKRIRFGIKQLYSQYVSPLDTSGYGKKGKYSIVKSNSVLQKNNIIIDDWAIIQDQTNFISSKGKLRVGKYSVISSGCIIVPSAHRLTVGVPFYLTTMTHFNDEEGDIVIEEDCWIGAGCILLPKCNIGRGAVVGAGSVVTKNVPPYAVVVGAPAHIIASKFSLEQIIRHEAVLYSPKERMSRSELELLFDNYYKGLKAIGSEFQDDNDLEEIDKVREGMGMRNHQND